MLTLSTSAGKNVEEQLTEGSMAPNEVVPTEVFKQVLAYDRLSLTKADIEDSQKNLNWLAYQIGLALEPLLAVEKEKKLKDSHGRLLSEQNLRGKVYREFLGS